MATTVGTATLIRAVVSIDLGTSHSGYAYAFTSTPNEIVSDQGTYESSKKLTAILFCGTSGEKVGEKDDNNNWNLEFVAFGDEARDRYMEMTTDSSVSTEFTRFLYFSRFKMELYGKTGEILSKRPMLQSMCGIQVPAVDVFRGVITHLKQKAFEHMLKSCPTLLLSEVKFVVTIPAIWPHGARQFMREVSMSSGIHILELALEPEVAALCCRDRHLKLNKNQCNTTNSQLLLLIDVGGGTADFTIIRMLPDGTVANICASTGGPWGSTFIDQQFEKLLSSMLSPGTYDKFMKTRPIDHITLLESFEIAKCKAKSNYPSDHIYRVRLPHQFLFITGWKSLPIKKNFSSSSSSSSFSSSSSSSSSSLSSETKKAHGTSTVTGGAAITGATKVETPSIHSTNALLEAPLDDWFLAELERDLNPPKLSSAPSTSSSSSSSSSSIKKTENKKSEKEKEEKVIKGMTYNNGMMEISQETMMSFFTPIIDPIIDCMRKMLDKTPEVKQVFLVGGLAESHILQHAVQQELKHRSSSSSSSSLALLNNNNNNQKKEKEKEEYGYLCPPHASLAVMTGAVMYGLNPNCISARCVAHGFGMGTSSVWNEPKHGKRPYTTSQFRGISTKWCNDIWKPFCVAGDLIPVDHIVTHSFTPVMDNQGEMNIILYQTQTKIESTKESKESKDCIYYVTDPFPKFIRIGEFVVDMSKGVNDANNTEREVTVSFSFGGTEIRIDACDVTSGSKRQVSLNFLSQSLDGLPKFVSSTKK